MKKIKQILLILLFMGSLTGVAQKNYTKESVKVALKQSYVDFVNIVRPAFTRGDSYKEFKDKVFYGVVKPPNHTLPPIPVEGEALLQKAYQSLNANYSTQQLLEKADYKTYGRALIYVDNYTKNNSKSVMDAEIALFGGNSDLLYNNSLVRGTDKCKWWQLWCHLNQVFGSSGGAQILQAIIDIILIIIL
ncbi:MAG TPA: hypothetical protein EYN07_04270 [Flavobacteriaceae bacterium]|jgi:hypothetical protein|nr:hypothetical protein [Flavobacteriaceae bacterium]HIN98438.1 hypothetical protein [Flavobacteriaceae bacterium]|tara:strand:- start:246 stop:815 length:570 start_codon:yes stop_codon:yes gene_type:complete